MRGDKKVKLIKLDVAEGPLIKARWLRTSAGISRKEGLVVQRWVMVWLGGRCVTEDHEPGDSSVRGIKLQAHP